MDRAQTSPMFDFSPAYVLCCDARVTIIVPPGSKGGPLGQPHAPRNSKVLNELQSSFRHQEISSNSPKNNIHTVTKNKCGKQAEESGGK